MLIPYFLLPLTLAHPLIPPPTNTTTQILPTLRLLLTLTTLEAFLHAQACNELDPFAFAAADLNTTVYDTVCEIAIEKAAIVMEFNGLLEALGTPSVSEGCEYDFVHGSVEGYGRTAREVGMLGVGAFLGGVKVTAELPNLQEFLASIATTEARHDAAIRAAFGALPAPSIHDTSIPPAWAYNLIRKWTSSCPESLGYPIFPHLNATTSGKPDNGTDDSIAKDLLISLSWKPSDFAVEVDAKQPLYLALVDSILGSRPTILSVQRKMVNGTIHTGDAIIPGELTSGVAFAALTTFVELNSVEDLVEYGTLAGPVEILMS
ncbi:hypothetical protein PRZ48_003186 [Zasmidium cellare]|uniref:Uncharacterized protein n=1 Tax=Zasmidium cellare TaxID=395010 RepID=A0ABR0EWJ9_ZASCE|nr:hypothetical protein PRZ48_003186 [Zasmidium cellare]